MSWLYTLVFSGLMLTSQESGVSATEVCVQNSPVAVVEAMRDETEKFTQTYPLNAGGRVNVSNVNGSIIVEAWDRSEVKLDYTKVADTKERLAEVDVKIESRADYFSVETDYGSWKRDNGSSRWRHGGKLNVELHLMVPRGAVLNEVETVNGSVTVSNFTNITRVSAVNGSVNASNIRGTAKLSTVNGEVSADFDRLETGSRITLETVNGRVNLVIPSDSSATVKADSLNGNITNDFGMPVRKGKYVGRDMYGRLGRGDVQIRLNSVNGGLSISRKNDGKTLSPAVNLLPQKEQDEGDWGDDTSFKSAKIDKEVAKAVKVSAKAAADAQIEIHRIRPEIAKITADSVKVAAHALEMAADAMKSEELRHKVREARAAQRGLMSRSADAMYFPSVPRVQKKSHSLAVKGVPMVTIDGIGCNVIVRGWDKSEVQYNVTQFTDPRNRSEIDMTESHTDSTVNLRVENPSYEARDGRFDDARLVRIEIFVPRKSNLKITANGQIRLEGVSGDVELTGSDEAINVRDVDGILRVVNSDGRIRVIGFRGELNARTSDGPINLEGDFRKLTARSSDGPIFLTLPENASANLDANCADITGEGISVTRVSGDEARTKYKIGSGGAPFQIDTDGQIRVRGSGILREAF